MKEYEEQQEFIARTEEFIRKYKAGQRSREARGRADAPRPPGTHRAARRSTQELEARASRADPPQRRAASSTSRRSRIGYATATASDVLVRTPELMIERGDRVGLIGPNGAGKTTLLRTLVGEIAAAQGPLRASAPTCKLGYYAQAHEQLAAGRHAAAR